MNPPIAGLISQGSDTGGNEGLQPPEAKESWAHFSTDSSSKGADTSSVSSETESIDDVWAINDEQRTYYTDQFKTMQPDTTDNLIGTNSACHCMYSIIIMKEDINLV